MIRKSLFSTMLRLVVVCCAALIIMSCSYNDPEVWPELRGDALWQELNDNSNIEPLSPAQNNITVPNNNIPKPPIQMTSLSLLDIQVTLSEIDRDLPYHEQNIINALSRFENAELADKASMWRGVEIQRSRLNDLAGKISAIEFQIADNPDSNAELVLARMLMKNILAILPNKLDEKTLALILQSEVNDVNEEQSIKEEGPSSQIEGHISQ